MQVNQKVQKFLDFQPILFCQSQDNLGHYQRRDINGGILSDYSLRTVYIYKRVS